MPHQNAPIGGFHALALPEPAAPTGLLAAWGVDRRTQCWRNASSAFAALLAQLPARGSRRIWLAALTCPSLAEVVEAMPECGQRAFYPVDADGGLRLQDVLPDLVRDDLVVVPSVLGAPPPAGLVADLQARAGVWTLEDCAQALDTGQPAWADWRLYSPRKLLGVPDGGLLVPATDRARALMPASVAGPPDEAWLLEALRPPLLRWEHGAGATLSRAHEAFREREAHQPLGPQAMSRLSWSLLALADPAAQAAQRRLNHHRLRARLQALGHAVPAPATGHAPLGLAMALPPARRDPVRSHMHRHGVFTAVYWPSLPSPADAFPDAHERAASHLVLPCDPQLEERQILRVAEVFDDAMRRAV